MGAEEEFDDALDLCAFEVGVCFFEEDADAFERRSIVADITGAFDAATARNPVHKIDRSR